MKNLIKLSSLSLLLIVLFTACGGGGYTYQWVQPKYEKETYENVMVISIGQNLGARQRFEDAMVQAFQAQGITATSSLNWMNNNNVDKDADAETLEKVLKENGFDGVMTAAAIDKDKETNYVQGNTYPGYYGRGFRGYYGYYGGMIQEPGYYTTTNVYMLQFNFYQLNNPGTEAYNALVWTVQDKVDEPSNPEKFTLKYCNKLVESMMVDGLF